MSTRRMVMICLALSAAGSFGGCRQIEPFFNMRPVEVRDYTPRERFVEPGSVEQITVRFSASMNRTLTETALRVEDGSGVVAGRFQWRHNDTELSFRPYAGFPEGVRYSVTVSESAEDRHGNTLLRELVFDFRTGDNEHAPFVVQHHPAAATVAIPDAIILEFSEPMQRDSVYRALSISPRINTAASWNECTTIVSLTPTEPFTEGARYEVHLNSDAQDLSGNQLSQDLRFSFRTGTEADSANPVVRLERSGTQLLPIEESGLNRIAVEKDDRFEILFPGPVAASRRADAVTLTPTVRVALAWNTGYTRAVARPLVFLDWQELYELNVLGTRYRLLVDGPDSEPIHVEGVALSSSASGGDETFAVLALGDTVALFEHAAYPELQPDTNDDIALDFALRHAPSATLSHGSLMSSFRISTTGGSITFAAREMIINPNDSPFSSTTNRSVVRFLLSARNQGTLPMDLLSIELRSSVYDSLHNRLDEGFRLEVNAW